MATEASIRAKLALILPLTQTDGQRYLAPGSPPDVDELYRRIIPMKTVLSNAEIEDVLDLILDGMNNQLAEIAKENWDTRSFTFEFLWGEGMDGSPLSDRLISYLIYHIFFDATFQYVVKNSDDFDDDDLFTHSEFAAGLESILEFDMSDVLLQRILSRNFLRAYMAKHQLEKSVIKPVIVEIIRKYLQDPHRNKKKMRILTRFLQNFDTI